MMTAVESLRQYRIGQFAIFDFTAAFLGMLLLAPLLSRLCRKIGFDVPKRNWIILTLPLATLAHIVVGKMTPMTKQFLDLHGSYFLKTFMLGLCIFGAMGIKRIPRQKG